MSNKVNMIAGLYIAKTHEQIAITDTAKQLTTAKYTSGIELAKRVIITVEDAQIRWTCDGTTPTSTVGHLANPMDVITLVGTENIQNFKAIRKGDTNGEINATFEF